MIPDDGHDAFLTQELRDLVNSIAANNRFMGVFSEQILSSHKNHEHVVSFIGISTFMEHAVKDSADMSDGGFYDALQKIKREDKITDWECDVINILRKMRNKVSHENLHAIGLQIDGIWHPFNENETYESILNSNLALFFKIIHKLIYS